MRKYRRRKTDNQSHYVFSAEIATRGKRIEQGTTMFINIEKFKASLKIGDVFRFSSAVLSMQYDGTVGPMWYTVRQMHPHVAYMTHTTAGGIVRGECMDYFKLMRCGRRCTDAAR